MPTSFWEILFWMRWHLIGPKGGTGDLLELTAEMLRDHPDVRMSS